MSIGPLLDKHGRTHARGRAARIAGRIVLFGAAGAAVALFLERAGIDMPLFAVPGMPASPTAFERVFSYLVLSFAGLLQGLFLLAVIFLVAFLVRILGASLLRMRRPLVAGALDRVLLTDRFSAALEATGPLAPLVARAAESPAPPLHTLRPRPLRRTERWLRRIVIALVLIVAVAPGTAPGEEGDAPVVGEPRGGRTDEALLLTLAGEKKRFAPGDPVPVIVIAEAIAPPTIDLLLPVRIVIDDGAETGTDAQLFLRAGETDQDTAQLDLRDLAGELAPGEHRAVAFAGDARSNEYVFHIEAEGGGGASKSEAPLPEPKPEPRPQKKPDGGGDQEWRPKFVEPLVRDGDKVKKNAKVPIEVPGGGAPAQQPLDEAWPELERRREAALDRPGLSPAARKLVREYFEKLRPEPPR